MIQDWSKKNMILILHFLFFVTLFLDTFFFLTGLANISFKLHNRDKTFRFWTDSRLLINWHLWIQKDFDPIVKSFWLVLSEAFFSRLQNRGGQNLEGCGNFSTACSFYCTADARSDFENLQKFLKKWLFWTYLVPIISKPI